MYNHQTIIIIDFGSQYSQLIARRVRELRVLARILPCTTPLRVIQEINPLAIILTGGPASVYTAKAPECDTGIFSLGVPVLGICYGCQFMCQALGGDVKPATAREFGHAEISISQAGQLFAALPEKLAVWMSHGDQINQLPTGFCNVASTETCPHAAIGNVEKNFYGVQFHPEVHHTPQGLKVLRNFIFKIAGAAGDWQMRDFIAQTSEEARAQVGDANVVLGLSGGVDSSVVAALLHQAIGKQLYCIFVDNGLLRQSEFDRVVNGYRRDYDLQLIPVEAGDLFLDKLAGVTDPEKKRKIIGHTFIDVFQAEAKKIPNVKFLAQGTLYPDVIESVAAHGGPTAVIKSHHNVGGLPAKMGLKLVEPLRLLFKDEVREIGHELGMPESVIWRHPFPGPGLAVRVLGEVTRERVRTLQEADDIVMQEIHASGWYEKVWQAFAVLLPVASVGVMGDERTYEDALALRVIDSRDGMTADWTRLPHELLAKISNRVINEVRGVNRVVYDISSKPPSTIEWE